MQWDSAGCIYAMGYADLYLKLDFEDRGCWRWKICIGWEQVHDQEWNLRMR